jgi:tRNA pseudouridine55 synthase
MIYDFASGELLLINKPFKWTSFDVVNKIRHLLEKKLGLKKIKVGHAGTLDPLATGLLILCTGSMTKKISDYQALKKEYTGTFTLGATTPSFDLETEVNETFPTDHITEEQIMYTARKFHGISLQLPPAYSAKRIGGKRAYEFARNGQEVEMEPQEVNIEEFEITRVQLPEIDFRIVCSKGTYIRSIAYDFGKKLNSGAYLSALCRSQIGSFSLDDSLSPEKFENIVLYLKEQQK